MKERACTFFGQVDAPKEVVPVLRTVVKSLIEQEHVNRFYIGIQGLFDCAAHRVLEEFKKQYPKIRYYIVLSHVSEKNGADVEEILVPEGVEAAPKGRVVAWRNEWMLKQSQYLVIYNLPSCGEFEQYMALAEKEGKTIIQIPSL